MNSAFAVISILIKSNMNVSAKGLKNYSECASIYKRTSP